MATASEHVRADAPEPRSLLERFLRRCTGAEGTGFAMSFLMHGCVLLLLALWMWREVRSGAPLAITISTVVPITTVLTELPLEMELEPAQPLREMPAPLPVASLPRFDHAAEIERLLAAGGTEGGGGQPSGSRPARAVANDPTLPKHAVRAGSFTAWWIPVAQRYGETVEPGQLPRAEQPYHIHVQIRVPDDRSVFRLDDLSGEIIGTDGYRQLIPDRAWILDETGKLVTAVGRRHATVRHGVAEIVFKVQGAGRVGIRDTITIKSRLLREEQVLTLEFQPPPAGE